MSSAPPIETVGFLSSCYSTDLVQCNTTAGLSCRQLGPTRYYKQCTCSPYQTFDFDKNQCRTPKYGDSCQLDRDCNEVGPLGSFHCRSSRCRCKAGYEPVDITNYEATSKMLAERRRLCVSQNATTMVPTGQSCTMYPWLNLHLPNVRICHSNAFCHRCKEDGIGQIGVCREFACEADYQCPGRFSRCNKMKLLMDPPCKNGICGCQTERGFYKDRFSQCSPRK